MSPGPDCSSCRSSPGYPHKPGCREGLSPCRHCGESIRWEDCGRTTDGRHPGGRWVHESSDRPPCRTTVAEPAMESCGAQDWATDDDDQPFIYGTCELPAGHDTGWHQQRTPSGKIWAEWRGPHDQRAPEGARDGFLGGGPHDR